MTVQELIDQAFTELGVLPVDQTLGSNESSWGLVKLNRLLSQWQTRRLYVAYMDQNSYTIGTPAVSGLWTIGPTGADFTATRPTRIESANLVLTDTSPDTQTPLSVINTDDYGALGVQELTSDDPTRLYYKATFPNGTIYLWPIPTDTTNKIQLFTWHQIDEYTALSDTVTVPPGYLDALVLSLAESMLPTYPTTASAEYIMEASRKARSAIQSLNSVLPNLRTADGFKGGGRPRPTFNYRTGI